MCDNFCLFLLKPEGKVNIRYFSRIFAVNFRENLRKFHIACENQKFRFNTR
jgi:hypothetical protein